MLSSANRADGRSVGKLTAADALNSLREYATQHGPDFGSAAFNPANAKWAGRPDLVERYYAGREDGSPWPSLNAIRKATGLSFTAAREAAGLPRNKPGPRRAVGEAEPIRDTRVQRVYVESSRDRELTDKLDRARARAERAERLLAEARDAAPKTRTKIVYRDRDRVVRERVPVTVTEKVIKEKVKVVKERVVDTKKVDRLAAKLADSDARLRASEDQLKAATRDLNASRRDLAGAAEGRSTALSEAKAAVDEAASMTDRLTAAEVRVSRLRGELAEAHSVDADARERAVTTDLVADAEARVERAEVRAARAERQMAEQGAAVTGELRRLTAGELTELRTKGPAGPAIMAGALGKLGEARKTGTAVELEAALLLVARAALAWRDRGV